MNTSEGRAGEFWRLIRGSIADAEAHLRSASLLLEAIERDPSAVADEKRIELARRVADLLDAADMVDARLLGIAAARLESKVPPSGRN